MCGLVVQVSLIAAFLLCSHAESVYDKDETSSYVDTPKFSLFNIERSAGDDSRANRELLIFEVPRQNQASSASPHLVSLENVVGPSAAAQSSAYVPPVYPQSSYVTPPAAPSWNYQRPYYVAPKQERPYYVAIEDVLPSQRTQQHTKHFSLFDVNLPAPPQIIINSYPKGTLDSIVPNLLRKVVAPPIDVRASNAAPSIDVRASNAAQSIDVRSSKATQKVHDVQTETTNRNTEIKVSSDKAAAEDPNRDSRSADEEDAVIIFPRSTDNVAADDSVEVLAPLDRLKRNIVSLENVVGPGQIGYPVYRYPQQPAVVTQPYRYPQQPLQTYPHKTIVIQTYPGQQYPAVCPYGNCYPRG